MLDKSVLCYAEKWYSKRLCFISTFYISNEHLIYISQYVYNYIQWLKYNWLLLFCNYSKYFAYMKGNITFGIHNTDV